MYREVFVPVDNSQHSDWAVDRAIERENDEVLEEFGSTGLKELKAIEAALDRVAAGTFGTCAKCGNPIAPARLVAVPHAALCEECIAQA